MSIRAATYALDRDVPYFIERGALQTLVAGFRHGADGGLVAPDSGTITIERADGTNLVSEAAATVSSSALTYAVTPSASEALGSGWTVLWTPTFDGVAYPPVRLSAFLVQYMPPNVISVANLYKRLPELQFRVPQANRPTSEGGSGLGWQPQIDEAYFELLRRMLEDGQRPWDIVDATGTRDWLLTRALQLCVDAISSGPDSNWAQDSKKLYFEMDRVEARLKFQYASAPAGRRHGAKPVIRLAPVGRPSW